MIQSFQKILAQGKEKEKPHKSKGKLSKQETNLRNSFEASPFGSLRHNEASQPPRRPMAVMVRVSLLSGRECQLRCGEEQRILEVLRQAEDDSIHEFLFHFLLVLFFVCFWKLVLGFVLGFSSGTIWNLEVGPTLPKVPKGEDPV